MSITHALDPNFRKIVMRFARITLLLVLPITSSSSWLTAADEGITQSQRGSVAVYRSDNETQIVTCVGPGSAQLTWPPLDPKERTSVSLRGVPAGISQLRKIGRINLRVLQLVGVAVADEDLDFIAASYPQLVTFDLCHPSAIPAHELSDLNDEERALFKERIATGRSLEKISDFKGLQALSVAGYALPPSRLKFLNGLKDLVYLSLCDMTITDQDLQPLSGLTTLEMLDLSGTSITGAGLRALRDCHSLRTVILNRTLIADELVKFLENEPFLPWKQLCLYGCKLTPAGFAAIDKACPLMNVVRSVEFGRFPSPAVPLDAQETRLYRDSFNLLSELFIATFKQPGHTITGAELSPDRLKKEGNWVFSALANIKGLSELDLNGCALSPRVLRQLQAHRQLEQLYLKNSTIDDAGLQQLVNMTRLKGVHLCGTNVTDAGVTSLSKIGSLEKLHLGETAVTDRGIRALQSLHHLRSLYANNCRITDEGAQLLANMPSLEEINLDGTGVTDRGLIALTRIPQLRKISLNRCQITDNGAESLLKVKNLQAWGLVDTSVSEALGEALKQHCLDVQARTSHAKSENTSSKQLPVERSPKGE